MYAQNQIHLVGHLTANPELRQLGNGTSVIDLNIKTVSKVKNNNGEMMDMSAYHTVTVWRKMAELIADYCRAGSQIYIVGRVSTDSWDDQNGNKRYKTKVTADDVIFLDPKSGAGEPGEMGSGLNSMQVLGNLTRDPELRQTTNGSHVVNFAIATNRSWMDRNTNEKKEETEFHNVVAWGAMAEQCARELKKGGKAFVRGRLQTRSWEGPDGEKRYATELNAEEVIRLGVRDSNLAAGAQDGPMSAAAAPLAAAPVVAAAASAPTPPPAPAVPAPAKEPELPAINYESDIKPEDLPF